ncbi:MAG TPA: SRPBCC family protein [Syntrophobacter fumaroxidans]|mgnify:CR=1 FL=1|nr:SRPBCC family protein [Syntrophobacter fumaroxidans]
MEHELTTSISLGLSIADVFGFFADPSNLERITPPELHFRIVTPRPITMTVGTLIDYRLRLFGVPFGWRTRISAWDPPRRFTDEQLRGPYRVWRHDHFFHEANATTTVTDAVRYALPLWPVGEIVHPLVLAQLRRIFRFRHEAVARFLTHGIR